MSETSVIFIDDEPDIRQVMKQTLLLDDLMADCYDSGRAALEAINDEFPGVILCDYNMPSMNGLEVLQQVRQIDPGIPVIILTGQGDISTAVNAMQLGAYDFIEKPFNHDELVELLKRALEKRQLALENRFLKNQLRHLAQPGPRLLGESPKMKRLMCLVDSLMDTSADILLNGETGSGKDALARYIHEGSQRRQHNFVAINCGAMPENLIESELFGHEPGAFTGAEKRRIGKFEYADKGTLFLDEVESMPMALQVKLLRVLEERKVERLGSNKPIAVDVRIIAATKADLKSLSEQGEFRSDLYYRLNVVELDIPPLRARPEDIQLLFHHFVLVAAARYQRESVPLSPQQMTQLIQHSWPGNVRELRNLAERYVLMGPAALADTGNPMLGSIELKQSLAEAVEAFESAYIEQALKECQGRIKDTMTQLGLPRKTLYDKMKKYALDKSAYKT
ncbi:MAG: sigma-54-dependent transcriptional regulator [Saccharospirillum sp.]